MMLSTPIRFPGDTEQNSMEVKDTDGGVYFVPISLISEVEPVFLALLTEIPGDVIK
jgi:hypothetical protein